MSGIQLWEPTERNTHVSVQVLKNTKTLQRPTTNYLLVNKLIIRPQGVPHKCDVIVIWWYDPIIVIQVVYEALTLPNIIV